MNDENNTPIAGRSFGWRVPIFGFVLAIVATLGVTFNDGKLSCAGDVDVFVEEGSADAAPEDTGEQDAGDSSNEEADSPESDTEAPAESSADEGSGEGSGS